MNPLVVTADRLRELLHYDPETGVFTWLVPRRGRKAKVGGVAGTPCKGYVHITVDGRKYSAHRLAWLYVHGVWPVDQIDHINGSRGDNRFLNLRETNNAQNSQNLRQARSNSKSGMLGVVWHKQKKKWVTAIRVNGKPINLGSFPTAELAHEAYLVAKREHHPACTI